jgi:hypothetical protein
MKRDPLRWLGWVGLALRVLFGGVFGAMLGFICAPKLLWLRDPASGAAVMVASAVILAYVSGRYGQELWVNLRDWLGSD